MQENKGAKMGFFSKFENKMEDAVDDFGDKFFDSPISPVQIAKKCEKQMRRNKMVGAGKQYAPTLYTVLVNVSDDARLKGYYPTLAGETETYLKAKANENGFSMDGEPLVRFMDDPDLKPGKFDVIAEAVTGDIISQLRAEEMERYGINQQAQAEAPQAQAPQNQVQAQPPVAAPQVKQSSPFADAPVAQPVVQNAPAPEPMVAPQSQPAPAPAAAVQQAPVAEPVPAATPDSDVPLSSSPTAVFAGGFDIPGSQQPAANASVPSAKLSDNKTGRQYILNQATVVIGRENTCNICLPDVNASRQHAQISYNNGA